MGKDEKISMIPVACIYRDNKRSAIEVELPGVEKKDVELEMTPSGFCVSGHRDVLDYSGCWILEREIVPKKAQATFKQGLLTATAPMAESMKRHKITIN